MNTGDPETEKEGRKPNKIKGRVGGAIKNVLAFDHAFTLSTRSNKKQ
jgi:hypothetical protein